MVSSSSISSCKRELAWVSQHMVAVSKIRIRLACGLAPAQQSTPAAFYWQFIVQMFYRRGTHWIFNACLCRNRFVVTRRLCHHIWQRYINNNFLKPMGRDMSCVWYLRRCICLINGLAIKPEADLPYRKALQKVRRQTLKHNYCVIFKKKKKKCRRSHLSFTVRLH